MTTYLDFDTDLEAFAYLMVVQRERPLARISYQPSDLASGRKASLSIIE
jgi:hypothetical protein